MKQGLALQEMATTLEAQRASKKDYIIDTRSAYFRIDDGGVKLGFNVPGNDGAQLMALRKTAHQQFANVLGVPKVYYDRMMEDAPDLLVTNLNHWMEAQPKTRLLRTMDNQVRAFLSDRYRPLDNFDLANAMLPKLMELEADVLSTGITEDRFYVKAVTERIQGEVAEGDTIQAGIAISNSEVGAGALRIEEMDYRLVCLNGMIREVAVRRAHLGRSTGNDLIDGAREFFRDDTKQLEDAAFWNKVKDSADAVFDQGRFNNRLQEYFLASQVALPAPTKVVDFVADRFNMVEQEKESVLAHLIQGGDLSAWGVANAVTRASQDVEDYSRATELEAAGGKVIELKPQEWEKIVA